MPVLILVLALLAASMAFAQSKPPESVGTMPTAGNALMTSPTKGVGIQVPTTISVPPDQRLAYLEKALAAANAKLELFALEIRLFRLRDQSNQAIERAKQAEQLVQEKQDASFREAYKPAETTYRQSDAEVQAATATVKTALKVPENWVISADGKEFKPPPPPPAAPKP